MTLEELHCCEFWFLDVSVESVFVRSGHSNKVGWFNYGHIIKTVASNSNYTTWVSTVVTNVWWRQRFLIAVPVSVCRGSRQPYTVLPWWETLTLSAHSSRKGVHWRDRIRCESKGTQRLTLIHNNTQMLTGQRAHHGQHHLLHLSRCEGVFSPK